MSNTEIKRYTSRFDDLDSVELDDDVNGEYVLFSDIEPVLKENEELKVDNKYLSEQIDNKYKNALSEAIRENYELRKKLKLEYLAEHHTETVKALQAKLDKAREALETIRNLDHDYDGLYHVADRCLKEIE